MTAPRTGVAGCGSRFPRRGVEPARPRTGRRLQAEPLGADVRPKCRAHVSPGNSDRPGLQFRPSPPLAAWLAARVRGLRPGAPRPADPAQGWFSLQQSPGDGAKNADSLDSLSRPHNSDCAFPEQDPEVFQFFAGGPGDFDAGDGCSLRSRVLICYRLRPTFLLPYRSDLYLLFPRQRAFAIAKTIFEPSFSALGFTVCPSV